MIEPQTPPARRVGPVYTPSTPRYGPMEDTHFLDTRKSLFNTEPCPQQPDALLTPRATPRKRILLPPKTPQRGSGRQGKRYRFTKLDEGVYMSHAHPHHDPPKVPGKGMWYTFRGKKVWRPFTGEEKPLKPIRLFETVDSDTETDIEH